MVLSFGHKVSRTWVFVDSVRQKAFRIKRQFLQVHDSP